MNRQKLDKIMFVLVVIVVSLSCGPPRFTPQGAELDDESLQMFTPIAGTYQSIGALEDLSEIEAIEDPCAPGITSYAGKKETLTFEGNELIISDEDGQRTYVYQNFGEFCRQLDDGKIECISQLTHDGKTSDLYNVRVYQSKTNLKLCYFGMLGHNRIDQADAIVDQDGQVESQPDSQSEPQVEPIGMDYNQTWDSGPLCGEAYETPYKWQVALIQSGDGTVNGTIRFHDCPGGGQVAYNVTGTPVPGEDFLSLTGTKAGGAGDLYTNSPETKNFIVRVGQPPEETSAP